MKILHKKFAKITTGEFQGKIFPLNHYHQHLQVAYFPGPPPQLISICDLQLVNMPFPYWRTEGEGMMMWTYQPSSTRCDTLPIGEQISCRKIPNCEDEKEPNKKPPDEPLKKPKEEPNKDPTKPPPQLRGNPEDYGYWLVGVNSQSNSHTNYYYGFWRHMYIDSSETINYSGSIYSDEQNNIRAKATISKDFSRQIYLKNHSLETAFINVTDADDTSSTTSEVDNLKLSLITSKSTGVNRQGGYSRRLLFFIGKQWMVQEQVNQRNRTVDNGVSPGDTRTDDDGFTLHLSSYSSNESPTLLDSLILEKGLPPRGGMNGSPRNRNKRRPKPNERRPNKMDERCCQMIAEIYEILAVEKLGKEGLEMPNKWFAPDGTGYKKAENYLDIQEYQMRMLDHYGIGPINAEIADANLLLKGNQEKGAKTINGTQAIQTIIENTMRNDSSNQAVLRAKAPIALSLAQIMRAIDEVLKKVKGIGRYLGTPVTMKIYKIPMPFTPSALKAKKASNKKVSKSGEPLKPEELNLTEGLNTILPKFIQNSTQEYSTEVYNEEELTLIERLNPNESIFR